MRNLLCLPLVACTLAPELLEQHIHSLLNRTISQPIRDRAETALAALERFSSSHESRCDQLEALTDALVIVSAIPKKSQDVFVEFVVDMARELAKSPDISCVSPELDFETKFPSATASERFIVSVGINKSLPQLTPIALASRINTLEDDSWINAWAYIPGDSLLGQTVADIVHTLFAEVQEIQCSALELFTETDALICPTLDLFLKTTKNWRDAEQIQHTWLYALSELRRKLPKEDVSS